MVTQSDVTIKTELEMAMASLTNSQLGMLSQVRPQKARFLDRGYWPIPLSCMGIDPFTLLPPSRYSLATASGGSAAQVRMNSMDVGNQ